MLGVKKRDLGCVRSAWREIEGSWGWWEGGPSWLSPILLWSSPFSYSFFFLDSPPKKTIVTKERSMRKAKKGKKKKEGGEEQTGAQFLSQPDKFCYLKRLLNFFEVVISLFVKLKSGPLICFLIWFQVCINLSSRVYRSILHWLVYQVYESSSWSWLGWDGRTISIAASKKLKLGRDSGSVLVLVVQCSIYRRENEAFGGRITIVSRVWYEGARYIWATAARLAPPLIFITFHLPKRRERKSRSGNESSIGTIRQKFIILLNCKYKTFLVLFCRF